MEIISIIFSIPMLFAICWGLGALLAVIIPDLEQNPVEQIVTGAIILVLIGIIGKL